MVAADATLLAGQSVSESIEKFNDARDQVKVFPIEKLAEVSSSDNIVLVASEGWKSKVEPATTGPSEELRGELARAPQDAQIVVAFAPRTRLSPRDLDVTQIRHGVMWAHMADDKLAVAARLEARDAAAATELVAWSEAGLRTGRERAPDRCKDVVGKLIDSVQIAHEGTIVTARAEIPMDSIMGIMFCGMK
jgi:hypothetical protein